jgi:hypothetical protein
LFIITEPAVSSGHEAAFFCIVYDESGSLQLQLAIKRSALQAALLIIFLIVVDDACCSQLFKTYATPAIRSNAATTFCLLPIVSCFSLSMFQFLNNIFR